MKFNFENYDQYEAYCRKERLKEYLAMFAVATLFLICFLLMMGTPKAHAQEFSDIQIVNAIRMAEGTWTYGIKTVTCNSETECRKITLRTVRNNRIRFRKFGYKQYSNFIGFLGSRYCPIGATNDPQGLNKNWIKNVNYFLRTQE